MLGFRALVVFFDLVVLCLTLLVEAWLFREFDFRAVFTNCFRLESQTHPRFQSSVTLNLEVGETGRQIDRKLGRETFRPAR